MIALAGHGTEYIATSYKTDVSCGGCLVVGWPHRRSEAYKANEQKLRQELKYAERQTQVFVSEAERLAQVIDKLRAF